MGVDIQRWDERYRSGDTPWDTGIPSPELVSFLDAAQLQTCRALELGCGSGTNVAELARRGFAVTGVDCSPIALDVARQKLAGAELQAELIEADVCTLDDSLGQFHFLFDRGCYHCARRDGLEGFVESLTRVAAPGCTYLLLAGNANEVREHGPPGVTEQEILGELGSVFELQSIREFRFRDPGDVEGPLGWSCVLRRPHPDS